ncbi:similar to Saccharomyces cerevisiae YCL014W BUD3 Protein involved in bud-site selection and required for axial budding pattern [Maudiozyma barnettii]|uniref:Similar to Saccharomyces cerevisiae YCL014W BUD3 Protein involved in bud-site selection and required for axial budding pattern n=1 Tax=Maudiozyma barnettii TaxID=61262 RepID=A0A8H2ZLY5_9SACH|nr:Bud3p [Kazachstania barnettii]CAB4256552.1 similar to Saccharomyces cerevisiae YCL014W BUD3 Protein involved in bud-site selection and required for axial budding pattern [Kazachstania barnettii]CAD1785155.1 similar to Saccharomyces cerevisiae YCL014W BUD3 Protein involved in bud-site selection and required for axial budding pattern [Kazachstania barnettii]
MVLQEEGANEFSSLYSHESNLDKNIDNLVENNEVDDPTTIEPKSQPLNKKIILFNNYLNDTDSNGTKNWKNIKIYWTQKVFDESNILTSRDDILWGTLIICIHHNKTTDTYNCLIFDDFGLTTIESVDTTTESPYYPAIENLNSKDKDSEIKRCIAVVMLQRYSELTVKQKNQLKSMYNEESLSDYDNVHAGQLASSFTEFKSISPSLLGQRVISKGLLDQHNVKSTLLDVIYQSKESTIELNNRLVFHLGEQLEQLFNPITEYSPEQTEYGYKAPESDTPTEEDSPLIKAICNELLEVQSNFTFNLVEFLQKFLITLRVQVLNSDIEGLSTVKLNRLFPPTIDEVTRINCIFLDSLKSATPYGSFEVLKACNLTIPYFYKAYTRHEAATKNFSKDIKLFMRNFGDIMPNNDIYTEMKLETIIKGPQEKLLKLKLILDRLYKKKEWSKENLKAAGKYYNNIIDIINSFGHLDAPMSSYNTRVFTPSGKILTELAKGWPVELQYKWLKRRIVGVFDIVGACEPSKRKLLVIFSDYIVFLNILDYQKYYTSDKSNKKPLISDILMNSLINELPLPPKIPKLEVEKYCYINEIHTSVTNNNIIRFDAIGAKEKGPFSVICKLASKTNNATYIADLITKAKILEKDTAFHLFKSSSEESILYFTAHELEAYNSERIKSKFGLFLNMDVSKEQLIANNLHSAVFAKFSNLSESNKVHLDLISINDNEKRQTRIIPAEKMVSTLISLLAVEVPICYSSIFSKEALNLINVNGVVTTQLLESDEVDQPLSAEVTSPNLSLEINEETKKSYGTITTFRSDVSDLVDVTDNKNDGSTSEQRVKNGKSDQKRKEEIRKKDNLKTDKKRTNRNDKAQTRKSKMVPKKNVIEKKPKEKRKNKGFFGAVKSIFSSSNKKEKKQIGKPVIINQTSSKKNLDVKPRPKSKLKPIDPAEEELIVSDRQPEIPKEKTKNVEALSKNDNIRISSVVHNANFTETLSDKQEVDKNEEIENSIPKVSPAFRITEKKKELPQIPINIEKHKTSDISEQPLEYQTNGAEEGDDTDIKLANPIMHQSQLFEDDLFGDFVSEKPKENGEQEVLMKLHENIDNLTNDHKTINMETLTPNDEIHVPTESVDYKSENLSSSDVKLEPNDEINNGLLVELDKPKLKKKAPIFPEIAKIIPPRSNIKFKKSPSFVELFRDMRIVLDDSDAKYNWKRLSTEVSLNEKYLVNNDGASHGNIATNNGLNTIAEKSYNIPAPSSPLIKLGNAENRSPSRPSPQKSAGSPFRALAHKKLSDLTVGDVENFDSPPINDSLFTAQNHEEYIQQNILSKVGNSTPLGSPTKPGALFKVINKSPTKFVTKHSKNDTHNFSNNLQENRKVIQLKTMDSGIQLKTQKYVNDSLIGDDKNAVSDFSFASNFNVDNNRRWVQLNVNSKEDLLDETFYTPLEEASESFSDPIFGKAPIILNPTKKIAVANNLMDRSITKNNIPIKKKKIEHKDKDKDKDEILDDLEFSSFDITFNTTNTTNDVYSTIPKESNVGKNILFGLNSDNIPKMDPPIVYRYSKELSYNTNENSQTLTQNFNKSSTELKASDYDNDDEPFWISPSKVDFTTISKYTSKQPTNKTTLNPIKYNTEEVTTLNPQGKSITNKEDPNIIHDMSFAFLGSLVDIDGTEDGSDTTSNFMNDKPTRLQFN